MLFRSLEFSVSACSREKREGESHGKDYYFISADEFRDKIAGDEFVEWQEVYPGSFYGTMKSEMTRIWGQGKTPIFDVDVVGGLNLKNYFGENSLAVFIQPPSIMELENRLRNRGTESEETLRNRIGKATYELNFASRFDQVIINDDLQQKCLELKAIVENFLRP